MDRDLESLKSILWEQFEKAHKRSSKYEDETSSDSCTPANFAIANRQAMGQLAQGIVAIEKEQRESKASAGFGFDNK